MVREKKLILVIDDQKDTRDLIQTTLTNDYFSVIAAPGGREGIQLAKLRRPDIILLDMVMPRFDGIQTCALLKKIPSTKDIPVIFLTASKDKDKVMLSIKAGGVDYVVKPFSPAEMLKRIQRFTGGVQEEFKADAVVVESEIPDEFIAKQEEEKKEKEKGTPFTLERNGKIMCMQVNLASLEMDSFRLFRDAFNDIINDGIIRIILDIGKISLIDGSGLCLLISVSNTLKSLGGQLCITTPSREAARQLSYVSLNHLLPSFQNVEEALFNVNLVPKTEESIDRLKGHLFCVACSYVNSPRSRFCAICGTRLDLGGEDRIIRTLASVMSRKILRDAETENVLEINDKREMKPEEKPTLREFKVEIKSEKVTLLYPSSLVSDKEFDVKKSIEIKAPQVNGKLIIPGRDSRIILENTEVGKRSRYESEILGFDENRGTLSVRYTQEAILLHSDKTFSVKIRDSIAVTFLDPKVSGEGGLYSATVVELSRLGMHVYSVDSIPVDCCLACRFSLPDGSRIGSALAVARRTEDDFLYNVEFVVIDEKERTRVIQYMYQRQIEQNK